MGFKHITSETEGAIIAYVQNNDQYFSSKVIIDEKEIIVTVKHVFYMGLYSMNYLN